MSAAKTWPPVYPSPSGRHTVQTRPWEAKMSHWVLSPIVRDETTGEALADLTHTAWSVEGVEWHGESEVVLTLREYPGDRPWAMVTIDVVHRTVTGADGVARALGQIEDVLAGAAEADTLLAVLRDTLSALGRSADGGPLGIDPDAVGAEVRATLAAWRAGRNAASLDGLFAPTGDLQEIAIANGWPDLYLDLAQRYDRARRVPPVPQVPAPGRPLASATRTSGSRAANPGPRRRSLGRRVRALLAVGGSVAVAWWAGGPRAAGGLAMIVAAAALPFAVVFVWWMTDPVGILLSGPKSLRRRIRSAATRPASLVALIAVVALGIALVAGGVALIAQGVRAR